MSLFVLDDHLQRVQLRDRLLHWATARYVRDIRPGEIVKDDRILSVLRTLRTPTFVTNDDWFWKRGHCDARYCIVYLALRGSQQYQAPDLLRRLLRLPEFRTRATRMGTVVWLSRDHVSWWRLGEDHRRTLPWQPPRRRRSGG